MSYTIGFLLLFMMAIQTVCICLVIAENKRLTKALDYVQKQLVSRKIKVS